MRPSLSSRCCTSRARSTLVTRAQAQGVVPVTISVNREVAFGESLKLVGSAPALGRWQDAEGAPMRWTEGHHWIVETEVPVGVDVRFKIVRFCGEELVEWEPCGDRTFQAIGPDFGLTIECAWGETRSLRVDAVPLDRPYLQQQEERPQEEEGTGRSHAVDEEPASVAVSEAAAAAAAAAASPSDAPSPLPTASHPTARCVDGLGGAALAIVLGDDRAPSRLQKLGVLKAALVDSAHQRRPSLDALAHAYVYATWVYGGVLLCHEAVGKEAAEEAQEAGSAEDEASHSGTVPALGAALSLELYRSCEWVIGDAGRGTAEDDLKVLAARRMLGALPLSFSSDPGGVVYTTTGLLDVFTRALPSLDDDHAAAVHHFLSVRDSTLEGDQERAESLEALLCLLTAGTLARDRFASGLQSAALRNDVADSKLVMRRRWRLADTLLEDVNRATLARIVGAVDRQQAASAAQEHWPVLVAALAAGVHNLRLSQFRQAEMRAIQQELQAGCGGALLPAGGRDGVLRAVASLERVLRCAQQASQAVADLYSAPALSLGAALGVADEVQRAFAESAARSSIACEVTRLATVMLQATRTAAARLAPPSSATSDPVPPSAGTSGTLPGKGGGAGRAPPTAKQPLAGGPPMRIKVRKAASDGAVPPAAFTLDTCGAKAHRCAVVEWLAAGSAGVFQVPTSSCVPFGVMDLAVQVAGGTCEFTALLAELEDSQVLGEELEDACARMRALLAGVEVPEATLVGLSRAFGVGALLVLRPSPSAEDAAYVLAAQGPRRSVVGVAASNAAEVAGAIRAAWASLYTVRAVSLRRVAGVRQADASMAVLVQELKTPEVSFVLHTARPQDAGSHLLLLELALGHGEVLSTRREQDGTPWRMEVSRSSLDVSVTAFASLSLALVQPSAAQLRQGGTAGGTVRLVEQTADYSRQALSTSADYRSQLARRLADVGMRIERNFNGEAQTVEGGLVRPAGGGELELFVFQTRPMPRR